MSVDICVLVQTCTSRSTWFFFENSWGVSVRCVANASSFRRKREDNCRLVDLHVHIKPNHPMGWNTKHIDNIHTSQQDHYREERKRSAILWRLFRYISQCELAKKTNVKNLYVFQLQTHGLRAALSEVLLYNHCKNLHPLIFLYHAIITVCV